MESFRLVTLLIVGIFAGALPLENHSESPTESPPFDAALYKEYLTSLKCPEIKINHEGVPVSEIGGIVYQSSPSTTLQPMKSALTSLLAGEPPALPSITGETISHPTLISTTKQMNSPQSDSNPFSKNEEHVGMKIKREDHQDLPDQTTSQPDDPDEVTPFEGYVDETNEQESDDTSANSTEECTAPLRNGWTNYNWYQILLDNGGPPGAYLPTGFKWNLTKALNPCERPVFPVLPLQEKTTFGFTHSRFEKVHRIEHMQVMLPGTPHEFVDVTGQLVWAPPNSTRRYFHMRYRKDDTGLYFMLDEQQKCVFLPFLDIYDLRVDCEYGTPICECLNGKETCKYPMEIHEISLNPALQASLIG